MSTIALSAFAGNGSHQSASNVRKVYVAEAEVDFAAAVTAKGSALAQGDVIEVLNIPAKSMILGGGVEVKTAMTGTSTDLTIDVGITGGTVDTLVNGFDLDGASAGDYNASGGQVAVVTSAADTLDVLIATQTGTLLTGVVRVWAIIADVGDNAAPGTTALGS